MADEQPGLGGLAGALVKGAAAQKPGDVAQERIERQRRTGILPPRGPMGAVFSAMGTPANMIAAAVNAPPGERLAEAGQAFMQRREGAQAEMLEKILPYEEGEKPVGLRSLGRALLSIGTDPLAYASVGRLTSAGRTAKAATPAKFMGKTAERIPKLSQIEQGLASSVGLRVPFTKPTLRLVPRKIDAAAAAATQAGLEKIGQTFKAVTYRGPGKTVTDWLRNAFDPAGATEVTKAVREGAEGAAERLRMSVFDDTFFTAGIEKTAEDIAAQVTPTAGRIVEPGEVFAQAWDWWENRERFPERFVDTPEPIQRFGEVIGSKFDELLAYQRAAGMDAPELQVPLASVRRKAVQEIRETEQALALRGEKGVERVPRVELKAQLRKRPGEAPEYYRPVDIESEVKGGHRAPKPEGIYEAEPGRGDVPGAFGRTKGKRKDDVPIGAASEIRQTRRQRPFDQIAEEQATVERARRAQLAADLNASITATIDNTLIDPRYLPVVFNKAGLKFLGITEEEMRLLALFGDRHPATIGIKAKDRFHKARTFLFPEGHPRAGTHLGAADIDRMAREGTLPGYEGRQATEPIVDIGPRAVFARLYSGRRAAEETRFLRDVAVPLGTKIRDTKHLAELERAGLQRMPGHWFLKDYAFPPEVFRELKPHLSYLVNPGPWLKAAHATAREAVRLWSEWTVLFPATIAANFVDETVRASMLGATKADFAYARGLFSNDWAPFNRAIERAADMEPGAQFLRGLAKDRIEGLTDGKVRPDVTPGAAGPEGIAGYAKTPDGARVPHVYTPHEIIREAFARKWAGGGYRMTDLQDAIDVGLMNARKPSVMRYIFHDSGISPFSRKFIGFKHLRKLQQGADDYPRLASAVSLLRRGLTPDEVSGEMGRFHPNVVLTPFERKVRNTAMPFYRWMRFAVPYAFRVTLERPTLPYLVWKGQQYLGLGGPRLEESDVPEYLRQLTGVPFSWQRDENGDTILSLTSANRMLSFMEITKFVDPKSAADTAYGLIFPALTYLAEMDTVSDKDDVFLGVRMNNKLSTFLRRTFRYGNMLDQMMLPKGQSETEKSVRRRDAMLRMFSPLSVSTSVAGSENSFRRYKIEKAMKDARARMMRSLSQYGRIAGTSKEADVLAEYDETIDALMQKYEALQEVTEPVPPFLQGAPR